jgi:uncharacterized damage-inducible protein DinB
MTKDEALARLAESRRALRQASQGMSDQEMVQVPVEGVWTAKDVLGHIASIDQLFVKPLHRYADGGPFEVQVIEDQLAWNDEQAACKRNVSLDAIRGEFEAIRRELEAAADRLSAGQWEQGVPFSWGGEGTVAEVLALLAKHELKHAHTIERWRENDDQTGRCIDCQERRAT